MRAWAARRCACEPPVRVAGILARLRGLPSPAGAPKAGPCFVVPWSLTLGVTSRSDLVPFSCGTGIRKYQPRNSGLKRSRALGSRHARTHPQRRCRLGSLGLGPGEGLGCSPLRVRAISAAWACWNPFPARAAGILARLRGLPSPAGAPKAGYRCKDGLVGHDVVMFRQQIVPCVGS